MDKNHEYCVVLDGMNEEFEQILVEQFSQVIYGLPYISQYFPANSKWHIYFYSHIIFRKNSHNFVIFLKKYPWAIIPNDKLFFQSVVKIPLLVTNMLDFSRQATFEGHIKV